MTNLVFVQLRCRPGTTYKVAEQIMLKEVHSELYSTSGDYDMIMKLYIPEGEDTGKFVNGILADVADLERSLTTMTFKAF
ncbi:Lrp/AsnC ligand binding domain-containing protein [Halocynthiibacter namhaensis]|uniref:Lrp/AsnC ligand binding domain-containing protein n=1 Tax=Halocynthiibacter namhaensis TaxID=1290553 RepID=UPI0005796F4C|nr:Lrp/AsnC ligand binding domain-containing protein [Halocynthiibacter namhaensis]